MNKQKIKYIVLLVTFSLLGVMWYTSIQKVENQKKMQEKIQTLPQFDFYTLEGDTINTYELESRSTFIIYFNTHCDFCAFEMDEIVANSADFDQAQLLFISSEKGEEALDSLSAHYSLDFHGNIGIYQCPIERMNRKFGKMPTPTVLLYDADRKLKKKFKGATRVLDMINELQSLTDEL